jgi:hypothetical protein
MRHAIIGLFARLAPLPPLPLACALTCLGLCLPRTALAQDGRAERRTDPGETIVFEEDPASGSTLGALGATITVHPSAFRMGLVRPRFNFVSEMLKSVEAL